MSVYKKLQEARIILQSKELKKSGHNKFSNYYYFELGDFLPEVQKIFADLKLCGYVSFFPDVAVLTIVDTEDGSMLNINSPMSSAALKGCHEVQNLGAVQTYLRRYLWVTAMEIVEHDALDAVTGAEEPKKFTKPAPAKVDAPKPSVPATLQGKEGDWQLKVLEDNGDWGSAVKAATGVLLQFAKDETDVQNIFKTNRTIYDKLKEEHEQTYADIMATFKATKEALTKE